MNTDIQDPSSSKWASSSSLASAQASASYPFQGRRHWHTSTMLSSTASDDYYDAFEQPKLTVDCRRRPPPSPVPSPTIPSCTLPTVAISVPVDNNISTIRNDVRPVLNPAASFRPPSPAPRFNGFPNSPLESPLSSLSPDPTGNVAINNDNTRLRTHKVSATMAFPPTPRPIAHRAQPSLPSTMSLLSNYLTMIGQEPTDTTAVAASTSTVAPNDLGSGVYSALADIERVTASPEFVSLGDQFPDDFDENEQTSPVFSSLGDDFDTPAWSPYDDFFTSPLTDNYGTPLDTPLLATPTMHDVNDYINSPVIAGDDDFGDSTMELFGGAGDGPLSSEPTAKLPTQQLWTISPTTPALDSIEPTTTVFPKATPVIPPPPAFTSAGARRNVTGTRKNLKPEALIPLDAPTQKRNYITPSATSRKAVPDAFAKKRLHSVAFDAADHDEEELPALSPTASEAEKIEHKIEQKRRQNTLSARKSRKRKLEHQQMLEEQVGALQGEVTVWRERALMAQEMLRGAGVDFSFDNQA